LEANIFKICHVTPSTPIRGIYDDSSFNRSGDMYAAPEYKNSHVTWPCPFYGWFVSHVLGHDMTYTCTQNLITTASAVMEIRNNIMQQYLCLALPKRN